MRRDWESTRYFFVGSWKSLRAYWQVKNNVWKHIFNCSERASSNREFESSTCLLYGTKSPNHEKRSGRIRIPCRTPSRLLLLYHTRQITVAVQLNWLLNWPLWIGDCARSNESLLLTEKKIDFIFNRVTFVKSCSN